MLLNIDEIIELTITFDESESFFLESTPHDNISNYYDELFEEEFEARSQVAQTLLEEEWATQDIIAYQMRQNEQMQQPSEPQPRVNWKKEGF